MRYLVCPFVTAILLGIVTAHGQHHWVVPPAPKELPEQISEIEFNNGAFLVAAQESLYQSRDARSGWIRYALEDLDAIAMAVDGEDIYYAVYGEKYYPGIPPQGVANPTSYLASICVMRLQEEGSEQVFEVKAPNIMEPGVRHKLYFLDSDAGKYMVLETGETMVSLIDLESGLNAQRQYGGLVTYAFIPGGAIFIHRPTGVLDHRSDPPVESTVLALWYYPAALSGPLNDNNATVFLENPPGRVNGLAYGNGVCVGVGEAGWLLRSTDLQTWEFVFTPGLPELSDVAYGDGYFVATGPQGSVYYSNDGLEWSEKQLGLGEDLRSVTHGNGQFVVLTEGGVMAQWHSLKVCDRRSKAG